jgi:EAL domain-containing protein (putative c-di-GMP-specific phosphodiesterase class I)
MFQLLGAETLMDGVPQSWGWIYFFLFAAGMCAILLTRQGLRLSGPVAGAASLLILATSSWLTTIHIINDPLPAIALIASVGIYITRQKAALLRSQRQVETGFSDMTGYSVKEVTSNAMFIAASLQRMETKRGYVLADDGVKIMKEVGRRLSTVIDESQLTHNKEQQFLWEMPQITTSELAAHLEGLRRLFGEPLVIDGRKIDVDIHFGIDRDTNSNIRRRMEKALNASIIARESQATFKIATTAAFDDHLKTHFASEFDAAIANGDVTCLFEAQPELVGGRIKSAEIALNWIHPAHGEIAKKKLFELARTSGNLDKVSLYLCDKAVNHAAELARLQPGFQLSLKISIQVVLGEAFKAWVRGYIQQENCRPNNIMFDIIDLHAHQNDRAVQLAVRELQQHNFRVGIGNFGITNGDIDLLNIFEPDGIFLSKSFAGELLGTTSNQFYAEAALRIAQASNIISTADGIDDREVLTELRKRGCACGMGKIISNPLVFNNFIETHIRQSDKKFG